MTMIKILLIFGVVYLQVAFAEYTEDDLRPIDKECLKELNLGADLLLNNFHEDWTVTEGNDDLNKVALCEFRTGHLLKDDDTLDFDKYKDFLVTKYFIAAKLKFDNPSEAATNGINACKSVQGSDAGDTLLKHYNCIVNNFKPIA